MITFKDNEELFWFMASPHALHAILIEVLKDIIPLIEATGAAAVITSAHRDKGIHATNPLRALDLRTRTLSEEDTVAIAHQINSQWTYDDSRPKMVVCYRHNVGLGDHYHLQVHPRTRRK